MLPALQQMATVRIPILMYHDLDLQRSPISISPRSFAWQMHWLSSNNYQVLSLGNLVQMLNQNAPLPSRSVVITFDDGLASFYQHAFPILQAYRFPATVFLVSDYCGLDNAWPSQPKSIPRRPVMTWQQISELDRYGIEFGVHTVTHPRLDRLEPAVAESEIVDSKRLIEDRLGHAAPHFAYPYGAYNEPVKQLVRNIFTGVCTTELGRVQAGDDPFHLKRIEALYVELPFLFRYQWRSSFDFYLTMRKYVHAVRAKQI
ncbi:polysaccharide deacetylase family protein [Chloroflexi bacterium TSY]|nr:polysaccharide deacetylase family protein [Chloroflexi bacterium TSY]